MNKKVIIFIAILTILGIIFIILNINKNENDNKYINQEEVKRIEKNIIDKKEINVNVEQDENGKLKQFDENGIEIPRYIEH